MLIGIDPLLSGEALSVLRDMGHGDTIAITDANFPSHFLGPPVIRMDVDATRAGRAILSVMPLDSFLEHAVQRMEIDGKPRELNDGHKDFEGMVDEVAGRRLGQGLDRAFPLLRADPRMRRRLRHARAPALRQLHPLEGRARPERRRLARRAAGHPAQGRGGRRR